MNASRNSKAYLNLPPPYRKFHDAMAHFGPGARLLIDPFRTLAYGTDASFYRLIPKIVIKVQTAAEVAEVLRTANRLNIPLTFRAAGTSLSGQAVTDSVLVLLAGAWKRIAVHGQGERITLEPGVIGAEANRSLVPYNRKIGPDPASINSCMIGGIAANNASGMCCGTAQSSYKTVAGMKILFADGTMLDTGDPQSRQAFLQKRPDIVREIVRIRDDISRDRALQERIIHKYRIKNTTGYSINAFVDYSDPIDIILHLMIGSEGTLGFIAEITYWTVVEHTHKASSLMLFPDIEHACTATMILKQEQVSSAELMDRASLRSVEHRSGLPSCLASLPPEAAALLVEVRAGDHGTLVGQMKQIVNALASVPTMFPLSFTDRKEEYEVLWDVRRGLFPAVGGSRRIGTTVVIEDVVFPLEHLAGATVELESLMRKHGYDEGIIFGHALDGNLHFVFTQDFGSPDEVRRYARLMDDVTAMVVQKYDGSLKGEHGTGRNMAPFVALEWGEKAYYLMQRIKNVFDPGHLLNPGVIINENHHVHLENLKPLPKAHEIVDKCIECGFCEAKCPSKDLTTTPRQRIVIQREISRLRATGGNKERLAALEHAYDYLGEQTCATDGLCSTTCPVSINTGDLTKYLRSRKHSRFAGLAAQWVAGHYPTVLSGIRCGLDAAAGVHAMLGTAHMKSMAKGMRSLSKNTLPLWNPALPKGVPETRLRDVATGSPSKVVYFPSCIVRTMGPAGNDRDQRPVFEAMLSILSKAGYDALFPEAVEKLCCGIPFESKGFFTQADRLSRELEAALLACSKDGEYPVLCDTSPCLHRMRRAFTSHLRLYEPVEFIHDFLMDRLDFTRTPETVAVHVTCSATRMGLTGKFQAVARACAEQVIVPPSVGCCGFAGDRGFTHPELNASALAELKQSLPRDCTSGYSNSRTCEIGLSLRSGVEYQSIVYLVDRCAARRTEPRR